MQACVEMKDFQALLSRYRSTCPSRACSVRVQVALFVTLALSANSPYYYRNLIKSNRTDPPSSSSSRFTRHVHHYFSDTSSWFDRYYNRILSSRLDAPLTRALLPHLQVTKSRETGDSFLTFPTHLQSSLS
jgi:hypothetical protein